jgi:CheY-like chemotaxis protein
MQFNPLCNRRLLVIDDNLSVHRDFRKILTRSPDAPDDLGDHESILFGERAEDSQMPIFEVDSAYQGEEGLLLIENSLRENRPYSLAFVDVRMPPGWDGVETTCKIWEKYPDLQVVICTAFADYSWEEMVRRMKITAWLTCECWSSMITGLVGDFFTSRLSDGECAMARPLAVPTHSLPYGERRRRETPIRWRSSI